MTVTPSTIPAVSMHVPWNKGKIIGAKPPLRPKHVWSIRTKLQVEGRMRAGGAAGQQWATCRHRASGVEAPGLAFGRRAARSNAHPPKRMGAW